MGSNKQGDLVGLILGAAGLFADVLPVWLRLTLLGLAFFLFLRFPVQRRFKMSPAMTFGAICSLGLVIAIVWQIGFGGGAVADDTKGPSGHPGKSQPLVGTGSAIVSGDNHGVIIGTQNNFYPVVPKKVKVLRVPAGTRFMVPKGFSGALVVDSAPNVPTTIVLPSTPSVGQRLDISDGLGHAGEGAHISVDGSGRKIGGFDPFVLAFSNQSITVTFDGKNWPIT